MIINNKIIISRPRIGSGLCELEVETRRCLNIDEPTLTERGLFSTEGWMRHETRINPRWDLICFAAVGTFAACVLPFCTL